MDPANAAFVVYQRVIAETAQKLKEAGIPENQVLEIVTNWKNRILTYDLPTYDQNPSEPNSGYNIRLNMWNIAQQATAEGYTESYVGPNSRSSRSQNTNKRVFSEVDNQSAYNGTMDMGAIPSLSSTVPTDPNTSISQSNTGYHHQMSLNNMGSLNALSALNNLNNLNNPNSLNNLNNINMFSSPNQIPQQLQPLQDNSIQSPVCEVKRQKTSVETESVSNVATDDKKDEHNPNIVSGVDVGEKTIDEICNIVTQNYADCNQEREGWYDEELTEMDDIPDDDVFFMDKFAKLNRYNLIDINSIKFSSGFSFFDKVEWKKKTKTKPERWEVKLKNGIIRIGYEDLIFHELEGSLRW